MGEYREVKFRLFLNTSNDLQRKLYEKLRLRQPRERNQDVIAALMNYYGYSDKERKEFNNSEDIMSAIARLEKRIEAFEQNYRNPDNDNADMNDIKKIESKAPPEPEENFEDEEILGDTSIPDDLLKYLDTLDKGTFI